MTYPKTTLSRYGLLVDGAKSVILSVSSGLLSSLCVFLISAFLSGCGKGGNTAGAIAGSYDVQSLSCSSGKLEPEASFLVGGIATFSGTTLTVTYGPSVRHSPAGCQIASAYTLVYGDQNTFTESGASFVYSGYPGVGLCGTTLPNVNAYFSYSQSGSVLVLNHLPGSLTGCSDAGATLTFPLIESSTLTAGPSNAPSSTFSSSNAASGTTSGASVLSGNYVVSAVRCSSGIPSGVDAPVVGSRASFVGNNLTVTASLPGPTSGLTSSCNLVEVFSLTYTAPNSFTESAFSVSCTGCPTTHAPCGTTVSNLNAVYSYSQNGSSVVLKRLSGSQADCSEPTATLTVTLTAA